MGRRSNAADSVSRAPMGRESSRRSIMMSEIISAPSSSKRKRGMFR